MTPVLLAKHNQFANKNHLHPMANLQNDPMKYPSRITNFTGYGLGFIKGGMEENQRIPDFPQVVQTIY